ncbi:hypothetical protein [Neorhizobium galegae]|uniref:hypothetical protein n=1 Tax=Neorhizobium galegae TaxID=399 RepID=UPI00062226C8|nr:hypothetical protein [Neorhizobium galegae]KAB1125558.1 hypothetical protein F4V90_00035 [Neorhizobium galegae]MCQ1805815.1 hypothetical protein [Neorhizobium galegae]CDZ59630.1 Hypothetical protein NGAL_HAMBI2566_36040 [Neorhizobium galegae bv. orientalis]
MEPTTLTSLSGSLMSLFGLLVSLFAVHLGNWLAKLQGLRTKWDINDGSDEKEVAVRRECRYAMAETYTWQPFVMTAIILCFGAAVVYFFNDVRNASGVAFPRIFVWVYNSFFIIVLLLQIFLLFNGWRVGESLKTDIEIQFPKPKT